jgi:hypothetical protein
MVGNVKERLAVNNVVHRFHTVRFSHEKLKLWKILTQRWKLIVLGK